MAVTKIVSGSFLVLFLLAITHVSVVEMTAAVQRSTMENMSLKGKEVCNPNDLYTDVLWAPTTDCTVYCTNWCRDVCVSKWGMCIDCCCKNNLPPPPPPPPSPPPPSPSPPPPSPPPPPPSPPPPSPPPPSPPPPSPSPPPPSPPPPPPSPPPPSPPPPSPSSPPPSPPPPSPPPCPSPEPCSCCGCCNTDVNIQISVTQGGNVKLSTPSSSSVAGHNRL
ncbi:hypothetical protein MKW98_027449 [Papaver atlanticum]|uniref:Uncharacterized protein n=1 Tax=Papaver atlanticum TaxID=357466 RepID=A0AAD4THD4_9MAGN|nr:hypothetical protein MKW98_027449 [Papaver atlanticum]